MALGDPAHQLEGSEGIVALAAEAAHDPGVLLPDRLLNGLCPVAAPVGVQEKHLFIPGKVVFGKFHHTLVEFPKVDARGEAD